mgnify:CR=1 FL=1
MFGLAQIQSQCLSGLWGEGCLSFPIALDYDPKRIRAPIDVAWPHRANLAQPQAAIEQQANHALVPQVIGSIEDYMQLFLVNRWQHPLCHFRFIDQLDGVFFEIAIT